MSYEDTINTPESDELSVDGTQEAYEKYEPDMRALGKDDKERVNVDPDVAVRRTLVGVRKLTPFASLLDQLPDRNEGDLEKLRGYALATLYAHKGLGREQAKQRMVQVLSDRGYTTRARLTNMVNMLIEVGILSPTVVDELAGGRGYTDLANDLRVLVKALQRKWSEIGDTVYLKKGDVDAAEQLSNQIYSEIINTAAGESGDEEFGAADMRRRAFTLLKRLFMSIRRSAVYVLEYTHDVDELFPAFATRSQKRARPEASGDEPTAGDETAADDATGADLSEPETATTVAGRPEADAAAPVVPSDDATAEPCGDDSATEPVS